MEYNWLNSSKPRLFVLIHKRKMHLQEIQIVAKIIIIAIVLLLMISYSIIVPLIILVEIPVRLLLCNCSI